MTDNNPSFRYDPKDETDDGQSLFDGWGDHWLDQEAKTAVVAVVLCVVLPLAALRVAYDKLRTLVAE